MKMQVLQKIVGIIIFTTMLFTTGFSQQLNYWGQADKAPQFDIGKSGDLLFDQMFNPGTGFMASHHFTTLANNTETCAVADDFDVPEGETWELGSIGILGTYWSGEPGGGDTLNVYILNDDNGIPGDTAYGYYEYTNFLKQEENINGYVNTYFEIFLPSGVTLTEGTYWVSVQMHSDLNVTGQWGWFDHLPSPILYGNEWHWINPKDGWGMGFTTWTPATTVVGPWLQHDVSFAIFGPSVANDISLLEITSPEGYYYGPPAGPQDVTVTIKNEGTDPQSGFDMKYNFNGVEVIENIGTITLNSNETYEFTFSQAIDLSTPGVYDLSVLTMLTGDENPDNDFQSVDITVFDPTVYTMTNLGVGDDSACSGTFADAAGLGENLGVYDWGTHTFYPTTAGAKIRLEFVQFDIGWSDFWIYDGENTDATLLGWYEDTISPGTLTAGYNNTSGALTIQFQSQGWTPFDAPGWAANILCHSPADDDFAIIDIGVSHPVITEYDHVTVYAHIKNVGTTILEKDVTFSANGIDFAVVPSGMVTQSDTVIVEATWVPDLVGDYEVTATLPDDQGTDNNNTLSTMQHVFSYVYFKEGFELMTFPPDGWAQTNEFWYRDDYAPAVGEGHARLDGMGAIFDTLITPKLHIEAGDKIKFSAFSSNWWPGHMNLVWIDAETGQGQLIQDLNLPPGWYSTFEIDVSAAAGNNYIGFAGTGMLNGGYGRLHLDEVSGVGLEKFFYDHDLKAYPLTGNNVPTVNTPTYFNVEIGNLGLDAQAGTDYTVKLMQEPGIEFMSYPGVDIDPKETIEFTLDYTFVNAGQKHMYVVVDFADDEDVSNNQSVPLVIFVQQTGTIQIPIGDGGTLQPWHPVYPGGGDEGGTFSQTLFLSEDVGVPMTITGIMYYYRLEENFPVYDFPIQLWFHETEATNVADSAFIPVTNMFQTFDGVIDFYPGDNGVYIPLDFPYPYTGQNLMVTAFKANPSPYLGYWNWKTTQTDEVMVRYINDLNDPIDPFDSLNINSFYPHMETEFANVRFFKIDLTGQYCIPQTINGTLNGDFVDGITFNELENLGTGSVGGPAYNNYTSFTTPVERDRYYELIVQAETSGENGSIAAWIDFNGDKDFDDDGERILHMVNPGPTQEVTSLVKIPADAELGITLMRVRNSSSPDLFTGCGAVDFGETEDYTINILATEQIHFPVPDFMVELYEDGNVDMNWSLPENPGQSLVEGYELSTWPPAGWEVKTSLSLDGTLEDPTEDSWIQYGDSLELVYNGAFAALCADSAPDFNWLITPPVQLYSNDDVSFMLNYTSDVDGYSKFYVLVEMDGEWTVEFELTDEIVYYNNYDEAVNIELSAFAGKTIRVAFVTENNNAYPVAIDDIVLKGIENTGKSVDGILGYNIYRNEELIIEITDPSVLSTSDVVTETENYNYCIKVVYDSDESVALCEEVFYLVPLTPPLNVRATADNNDVTVKWVAPNQGMMRFEDGFEDYSAGQQVACQNPDDWSTWTQEPCSANDPYITDERAYTGEHSVVNEGASDLLFKNDEILTTGKYSITFMLYIQQDYNGYFNVLQEHDLGTGSHWGFQAFFDQGGEGTIDAGGYSAAIFDFEYNDWMYVEVMVDLDTDWAEFAINDDLIYEWQWSLGIAGGSDYNTLQAVDWYSWSSNAPARFFMDDFQIIQLYNNTNELSFNVYRNDELITNVSETEYYDDDMEAGTYNYCISAIYDEGESETDCDFVTFMTAPENFTAEIQNENNVYCEWNEVVSSNLDGYKVYRNGDLVSGLVTENNWTDEILEAGTYYYYVTAVYGPQESDPSNSVTLIVLITPKNLVANADSEGNIVLNWDPLGEVMIGDFVELFQHDGNPVNGLYQYFNNGYGVVFDLSAYPGATIEMADFHHGSFGLTGTWFYKFHVVDWSTATSIAEFGPFSTTGDDIWETEIPLGSVEATSNLIGIFMEPMSVDPANAYPVLSSDENLDGFSVRVYLNDLTAYIDANSDFLLDLWIFAPEENKMVQPKKVKVDNLNLSDSRKPYNAVKGEIIPAQKEEKGTDALFGYNVYYAHESDPFEFLDIAYDTTYSHEEAGLILGMHNYYVTAIYSEGESDPSEIATEYISGISENELDNMQIYPNPILEVVNIETDHNILSVVIINSKGQVIFKEAGINSNNYKINIANQPTGLFNVRVETEEGWMSRKMIKR